MAPARCRGQFFVGDGTSADPSAGLVDKSRHGARDAYLIRRGDVVDHSVSAPWVAHGRRDGITFRELAAEYLEWVQEVKDAKPSGVSGFRYLLMEPGTAHRRGDGQAQGFIMAALGEKPVTSITTLDVEDVLRRVAAPREKPVPGRANKSQTVTTRVAPRTINQHRQLMCAIFNYAMRPSTYALAAYPARFADRRREPERGPLAFYTPEQIEAGARSLAPGAHRDVEAPEVGEDEQSA